MASGTELHRWIWRGSRPCGDRRANANNIQANHSTLYPARTVMAGEKTPYAQPLWASGGDRRNEDPAEIHVSAFARPICQKLSKGNSGDCRLFETRLTYNSGAALEVVSALDIPDRLMLCFPCGAFQAALSSGANEKPIGRFRMEGATRTANTCAPSSNEEARPF